MTYHPSNRQVQILKGIAPAFAVVLLVGGVLVLAQAARPTVKFEAEAGLPNGDVTVISDPVASSGQGLMFTEQTTLPGSSNLPMVADFDSSADQLTSNFLMETIHGTGAVTASVPTVRSWTGDHNTSCGAVSTTRTVNITAPAEQVYWCGAQGTDTGHVHTSMRTAGFSLVSFSPNKIFTDVGQVCWDMTMFDVGSARFPQLTVVPETTFQANGQKLAYVSGANAAATPSAGAPTVLISGETFLLEMPGGATKVYRGNGTNNVNNAGFVNGTDKERRFRNCVVDNENGTVTLTLERASSTETRTQAGAIPNGPVRVIFGDNSQNTSGASGVTTTNPNTIHWDAITLSL